MDMGKLQGAGPGSRSAVDAVRPAQSQPIGVQAPGAVPAANDAPARPATEGTRQAVEQAVVNLQDFVQTVNRDIRFSVHDDTGEIVVQVTDSESGDVIRQIPSEDALELAKSIQDVRSLLFETRA